MKKIILNLAVSLISLTVFFGLLETGTMAYMRFKHKFNEYEDLIESQGFTPRNKKPGEIRLALIGESAARGVPYSMESSMSGFLQKLLDDSGNGQVKVVNTGIPGRHSFYQLEEAATLFRYKIDGVIIYAGNNDTRDFSNVIRDVPFAYWDFKLTWNSFLYRRLKEKIRKICVSMNERMNEQIFDTNPNQDDAWHWTDQYIAKKRLYLENPLLGLERKHQALKDYENNLDRLTGKLLKKKIDVFIAELPIVHKAVPGVSDIKKGLGPGGKGYELEEKIPFKSTEDENLWHQNFNAAQNALTDQAPQKALPLFLAAYAIDSTYPLLAHNIAQAYEALGNDDKAREFYILGKDLQIQSPGGDSAKMAALHRISESHHISFIPVQSAIEEISPNHITGENLFLDHCHPNVLGHKVIASALMAGLCKNTFITCPVEGNHWQHWFEKLKVGQDGDDKNLAREYVLTAFYHFNGNPWDKKPDYKHALYYLEKARELDPGLSDIYSMEAAVEWQLGNHELAQQALVQLKTLDDSKFRQALNDFPYLKEISPR